MDLSPLTGTLNAIYAFIMGSAEVEARKAQLYTEMDMLREQLKMKATELAELELRTGQAPPEAAASRSLKIMRDVMGWEDKPNAEAT